MPFVLFLIFLSLISCGSPGDSKIVQLPVSQDKFIVFSGELISPPSEIEKEAYRFRSRFYNCPVKNFGKFKPDNGTYAFSEGDCRLVYTENHFSSEGKKYNFRTTAPKTWTHAFIELEGMDPIAGMYSPGENPFWFVNSDSESKSELVLNHNFDFESMENPIPDKDQDSLASKFSPIIVLKKDKVNLPTNIEKYYRHHSALPMKKKKDSDAFEIFDPSKDFYLDLDSSLYNKGDTHIYYHVRPADTMLSGMSPNALPGFRDNRNYRYLKGSGNLVISYYIWYDFNAGPSPMGNNHQGDLESFAILVDSKGNPLRFMVTGHDHVMLDTSWTNINSIDNHPIIYIAHGRNSDGGNPTSPYGGYEVGLEAGNALFNSLADPKDIFPAIGPDSQLIVPGNLNSDLLKNVRIGPGEWLDPKNTKYIDASPFVTRKIARLVKWEEPGWINKPAVKDPDKTHSVPEESAFFMNFAGRLGKNPHSELKILSLSQWGKSPVNVPFKMNDEQHFTYEKPSRDRCEKARVGDYCEKFKGDEKTPQSR